MKILVVEDDALLRQGLLLALEGEGYICDGVTSSREAEASLTSGLYSLLILDLGLPDEDGLCLLSRLRRQRKALPVLILTARDTINERIAGLDAGADDYLIKPFALDELLARIRALIRRHLNQADNVVTAGNMSMDMVHRQIRLDDKLLELTPKEYSLLCRLMLKAGQPVHREILFNDIYNWDTEPSTNTLEVHIHNLRDKIGKSAIRTVRGFGYALLKPDKSEPE
ncbi:two-component system response regulator PmrA [Erwinia sp. 9145]|uniref:two-component system response regulator PmrA n=1 Tax=Erwinia sp. 9145 TaxID=1500895 RepID=UPI000556B2B8|nr:two-component system response regulator PmrA [Erwinia sp. 9145]